jgi:manganese/zinc/iron transport system permease protein
MSWLETLSHPLVLIALSGNALIAAVLALVGCLVVLRREAFVGDVLGHSVLPGIALAFVLVQSEQPGVILAGALGAAAAAMLLLAALRAEPRLREDARLGVVLSLFFGVGIVLLTVLQRHGIAHSGSLWRFLFGQAAGITPAELGMAAAIGAVVVAAIVLFWRELQVMSFDAELAQLVGLPIGWLELLYRALVLMAVVVGVYSVGAVLVSAMLILPAIAARALVRRLPSMLLGAAVLAAMSAALGVGLSGLVAGVPTGPTIVLVMGAVTALVMLAGARQSVLMRALQRGRLVWQQRQEDVLKLLYKRLESGGQPEWSGGELLRTLLSWRWSAVLVALWLALQGKLRYRARRWELSPNGVRQARQIVRRHRLWELYLERYVGLPPEQLHNDAEMLEHLLPPEMTAELERLLGYPTHDPHGRPIPPED